MKPKLTAAEERAAIAERMKQIAERAKNQPAPTRTFERMERPTHNGKVGTK